MWSTSCSAIEPRPPADFFALGHAVIAVGSWQARALMCEAAAAGVASVISAVETSPTFLPAAWNLSRTVS
ncbi:hypothetical protein NOZE110980_18310 [Nocardioides zeicaulis]